MLDTLNNSYYFTCTMFAHMYAASTSAVLHTHPIMHEAPCSSETQQVNAK